MLNRDLEQTLQSTFDWARRRAHEFVTVEHLLLLLLDNASARGVLRACGADLEKLAGDIEAHVKHHTPRIHSVGPVEVQPTLGFQRVLQRAVFHVQMASSSEGEVTGADVLAALFDEEDSQAVYLLVQQDVERLDIINYLAHGLVKAQQDLPSYRETGVGGKKDQANAGPLHRFTENLNAKARSGGIDPLIGRAAEIERAVHILCRRRKNNPLFVGEAGVGKTALAEGLAHKITEGEAPDALKDAVLYALDLGGVIAGAKYRGDFEKRLKQIFKQLLSERHAILFIDEIHTLIGAGAASGGALDASNLLKPLLSSGRLKCIGSTTYSEYRNVFEKDKALARRFQKIDVEEPSVEETRQILIGLKSRFEEFHRVKYPPRTLKAAAELADKHLNDRALPDKAIDIVDETGAYLRSKSSGAAGRAGRVAVTVRDIERTVARMARVPPRYTDAGAVSLLKRLERDLKKVIFGQDEAVGKIVTAIKVSRSGLKEPDSPVGSFLCAGPTGVGKTEVARQLALLSGIRLLRFDMSEYMERHTVSRLIGAPPGYVGYDQGGLLSDAVLQAPHAVVLLDEIEKAHPDIFNLLLQVMDYGALTDANGRSVSFRNVILIMTTNAGAAEAARENLGFTAQDRSRDGTREVKRLFAPEFRNRLDAIVNFNALSEAAVLAIVDKFAAGLQAQLESRRVQLKLDVKVRRWLARRGFSHALGARPMQRLIAEQLKKPLLDDLLFGPLKKGGVVKFTVAADRIVHTVAPHTPRTRCGGSPVAVAAE